MESQVIDPQRLFATATLMCVVWLGALTMLARQAQVTDLAGGKRIFMSAQPLAYLMPDFIFTRRPG
jgi:hypothetical protein